MNRNMRAKAREMNARREAEERATEVAEETRRREERAFALAQDEAEEARERERQLKVGLEAQEEATNEERRKRRAEALGRLFRWGYAKAMDRWAQYASDRKRLEAPVDETLSRRLRVPGAFRKWRRETEFGRRRAVLREHVNGKKEELKQLEQRLRDDAEGKQRALDEKLSLAQAEQLRADAEAKSGSRR